MIGLASFLVLTVGLLFDKPTKSIGQDKYAKAGDIVKDIDFTELENVKVKNTAIENVINGMVEKAPVEIKGAKVNIQSDNKIGVKLYISPLKFPTSVSVNTKVEYKDDVMILHIDNLKLGAVRLPLKTVANAALKYVEPNKIVDMSDALNLKVNVSTLLEEQTKSIKIKDIKTIPDNLVLSVEMDKQLEQSITSVLNGDLKASSDKIQSGIQKISAKVSTQDKQTIQKVEQLVQNIKSSPANSSSVAQVMKVVSEVNTLEGPVRQEVINTFANNISDSKKRELLKAYNPSMTEAEINEILKKY